MSKQPSLNDPMIGTWKLNLSKSTHSPGPAPKSAVNKFEPWEDGMKATIDLVDGQGNKIHAETAAKFDGKDHRRLGKYFHSNRASVPTKIGDILHFQRLC